MPDEYDRVRRIDRNEWRLDALDRWRSETVDPTLIRIETRLHDLVKADEIAEAVAEKMKHDRTLHLTLIQKGVAVLVAAVALADGIRGLFS